MSARGRKPGAKAAPKKVATRRRRTPLRRPLRVISGGQTGVDRAALDAALACGLEIGGWCPSGRRAEDGRIASRYPLHETPSTNYAVRTRWNVRDADATLILSGRPLAGGTALTVAIAEQSRTPLLVIDSSEQSIEAAAERIRQWIDETGIQVLNVAGPRESTQPGVYHWSSQVLQLAFAE